jgi:PKD repeat protein
MGPGSFPVACLVLAGLGLIANTADAGKKRPNNKPPRVTLSAPSSAVVGRAITIDGSGTIDPDGALASWEYVFGDGARWSGNGQVLAAQHTYSIPGTYTVRLTATDKAGASASATASIAISAPALQVSADGTRVGPATQIVDNSLAVWTVAPDLRVLRNGVQAAGGYAQSMLWLNQTLYVLGLDGGWWYLWNGSGWTPYGQTAPGTAPTTPPPSSSAADYTVEPGQNIQTIVDVAPEGASILLRSGVHRVARAIVPRSGQTILGETGTVLSGARILSGFTRTGSYWVIAGQTQGGTVIGSAADGVCSSDQARCGYPEDLFINHVLAKHVATLAEVGPGRWYFDYATDRIYIGEDPTGRLVETSVVPFAFEGSAPGVTVRAMVIEKFASPTHEAAVNGRGLGWTIENCEVRWNHFAGIRTVDDARARSNLVHHNGAFGFIGSGRGVQVEANEIAYNNTRGYNPSWGAGGSKWVYTDGLIVRNNFSHHNSGPGLWTDINNINVLYEGNRVEDNDLSGIFHEIGYAAVIRNNRVSRNGRTRPSPGWVDGAGILVAGSSNVEVYGNTLVDNWQGIAGLEGHRGSGIYGEWVLQNLHVHDNSVTQTGTTLSGSGRSGIIDTSGTSAFGVLRNNKWVQNTYWLPSTQSNSFIWTGRDVNESGWITFGQDVTGTFNH